VGALALGGLIAFLPKSPRRERSFDFFGFAMLSITIGALQLMLDRGEQVDWFASAETWIHLGLVSGTWAFLLHVTGDREHPFIDPAVFRDRTTSRRCCSSSWSASSSLPDSRCCRRCCRTSSATRSSPPAWCSRPAASAP
jgi:hypothetical protein